MTKRWEKKKDENPKKIMDLLHDLSSISELLALEFTLPGPKVIEELLLLSVVQVNGGELERGNIRDVAHLSLRPLLTTQKDGTEDFVVVFLTEDKERTDDVLAEMLGTLAETTQQVGNHEQLLEILRVLVLGNVTGPVLLVQVLVEVRESDRAGVLVGVADLELVHVPLGLGVTLERLLGLGLGGLLDGLGGSDLGGGGLGGFLLDLLLGGGGDGLLDAELEVTNDGLEVGLVDTGQEPPVGVSESLAESRVEDQLVGGEEREGNNDVSQGKTVTNEEGLVGEVDVEGLEDLADITGGALGGGDIVGDDLLDGEQPGLKGEVDLVGSEVNPSLNQTLLELVGSKELRGVTVGPRHEASDGVALEDSGITSLKDGDLLQRVAEVEASLGLLNSLELDLDIVVTSSNQGLLGQGAVSDGLDSESHIDERTNEQKTTKKKKKKTESTMKRSN